MYRLQEENSNLVKQKESSTRNLVQPKLDKQFKKETEVCLLVFLFF